MGGAEVRVVLTPHMDAEVIGMGGTIALLSKAGYDVVVAYLTDGAGAFEGHVPEGEERAMYSGIRKEEAGRALGVLGVRRPPVFLDFPDSRLDEFVPRAVDRGGGVDHGDRRRGDICAASGRIPSRPQSN